MSAPARIALCLALAALAAAPVFAGEVEVGARTELWYDDNVLGSESNEISEGERLISPTVEVSERFGDVDASLWFKPNYELFFDQADLRGFNYQTDGRLTWSPSQRTQISLVDSFWRYRSLRLLTTVPAGGGTPAEAGARDRFTRNVVQLTGQHRLTRQGTLRFGGSFALWRFENESRVDQDTFATNVGYDYLVTRTLSLGGTLAWSRLSLDQRGLSRDRETDYVNASLVLHYEPIDTFFVRASAGPTYVRQPFLAPDSRIDPMLSFGLFSGPPVTVPGVAQEIPGSVVQVGPPPSGPVTCPVLLPSNEFILDRRCNFVTIDRNDPSQQLAFDSLAARWFEPLPFLGQRPDRDDFTYFADVSVERRWADATLALAYNRDQASNSSVGFSSVGDTVALRGSYRPFRELSLFAAVIWEDRVETQAGAQVIVLGTLPGGPGVPAIGNLVPVAVRALNTGSFAESVKSVTTYLSAQYHFTKRARLDAAFQWRDQNASESSSFNDYQRLWLMLGVTVELEPFRW